MSAPRASNSPAGTLTPLPQTSTRRLPARHNYRRHTRVQCTDDQPGGWHVSAWAASARPKGSPGGLLPLPPPLPVVSSHPPPPQPLACPTHVEQLVGVPVATAVAAAASAASTSHADAASVLGPPIAAVAASSMARSSGRQRLEETETMREEGGGEGGHQMRPRKEQDKQRKMDSGAPTVRPLPMRQVTF